MLGYDGPRLAKHVGNVVRVKGIVSDADAKITFKSKTKAVGPSGTDRKIKTKSEVEGDEVGMPYLAVQSIRTLSRTCS